MKNLDIKIAFFDIDGTLTNSNKDITKNTLNTLKRAKEKGIKIVLCSGRANSYITNLINTNYLDFIISSNGSRIFDISNNKNIYTNYLNTSNLYNIWNYSNENKIGCILVDNDFSYYNNFTDINSNNNKNVIFKKIENHKYLNTNNLYQIILESTNTKKMSKLENYLTTFNELKLINYTYDYKTKDYCFFDVVNNNVSKGNAIKYLLDYLKINKNESICFGDSVNDLEMFASCGFKVAMGNAIDSIKKESDYITDTNNNDGITKFFNNYIFK